MKLIEEEMSEIVKIGCHARMLNCVTQMSPADQVPGLSLKFSAVQVPIHLAMRWLW